MKNLFDKELNEYNEVLVRENSRLMQENAELRKQLADKKYEANTAICRVKCAEKCPRRKELEKARTQLANAIVPKHMIGKRVWWIDETEETEKIASGIVKDYDYIGMENNIPKFCFVEYDKDKEWLKFYASELFATEAEAALAKIKGEK